MTRVQRLESIAVIVLVIAGMVSGAAAALGLVPVTPPQVVAGIAGMLAVIKAAATAGALFAFAGRVG